MMIYLQERFPGYRADFVFNPNNGLLYHCLNRNGAEFLEEEQKGDAGILKQLMSYDLYARENLKTRPFFAKDDSDPQWRRAEQIFYQNFAHSEKYLPGYREYDWKQTLRMTHLERFDYDVLRYLEEGKLECKKSVLLFDYRQRNPLNKQARVLDVTEKII